MKSYILPGIKSQLLLLSCRLLLQVYPPLLVQRWQHVLQPPFFMNPNEQVHSRGTVTSALLLSKRTIIQWKIWPK